MNCLKLIRPLNLLIIALTMILFRVCIVAASPYKLFYISTVLSTLEFALLVIITITVAASGYVINDIFDVEIDAINRPHRVIVGQQISETQAYNFYKLLCGISIFGSILLAILTKNIRLSMLPLLLLVVLNFYAHTFKKQLIVGNFLIALLSAFVIWLIALFETTVVSTDTDLQTQVKSGIAIAGFMYGLFAFLTTFMREIVKDLEDMEGDKAGDCNTIPFAFGVVKAKIIVSGFSLIILMILSLFVWFFPSIQIKNVPVFIVILLILPLIFINILLFIAKTPKSYNFVSNLLKIYMVLGIASLLYFRSGIGPYIFMQFANFIEKLL